MPRILFLALLTITAFAMLPNIVTKWMVANGYLEADANGQMIAASSKDDTQKPASKKNESATVPGRTVLPANNSGHFLAKAYVNNRPIRALIDTGATYVSLSYEDARKIGIKPRKSEFTHEVHTANGVSYAAFASVRSLRIGQVTVRNLKVMVAPEGALSISLVGMNFLRRLRSFQVEQGKLILES